MRAFTNDELVAAIRAIAETVWRPNPDAPQVIYVKHGQGEAFAAALERAAELVGVTLPLNTRPTDRRGGGMSAAGRHERRNSDIARRKAAGETAASIGRRHGLSASRVFNILVEIGAASARPHTREVEGIWAKPQDELRRAIYARQRAGARAALAEMEGRST